MARQEGVRKEEKMNIREEHYNKVAIEGLQKKIADRKSNVTLQRILFLTWSFMAVVTLSALSIMGG